MDANGVVAIALLPEELWLDILERLGGNLEDLLSCYRTCPLWNALLGEQLPTWLFEMVFPPIFQYLSKTDITECRQVCKSWCLAIDKFLEQSQPVLGEIGDSLSKHRSIQIDFHQSSKKKGQMIPQTLGSFETQFGDHPQRNPFVSRSVHLIIRELGVETINFFEKWGSHIWYLDLKVSIALARLNPRFQFFPAAQQLWQVLGSMSNLKKLKLAADNDHSSRALDRFLHSTPPPALPHLKMLDVSSTCPPELRHKLEASYASQLTALHHSGCQSHVWPVFPLLTTLSVDLNQARMTKYLENSTSFEECRLEILQINVMNRNVELKDIFKWAEKFGGSLHHLSIKWANSGSAIFPEIINLPKLKELELWNLHLSDASSFEFLASLGELETLKIHFTLECYTGILEMMGEAGSSMRTKVIDMHQLFDKLEVDGEAIATNYLYRSNVWSLVPKLERVVFSHPSSECEGSEMRTYTRQQIPAIKRSFKMDRI